jgi:hypothetical protein
LLVLRFFGDRCQERVDGRPEVPVLLRKFGRLDQQGQAILPELPATVLRPVFISIFR